MTAPYRRRVGAVRPSHLMFTSGVGALIDLPNFSVLVRGLDDWNYGGVPDWEPIAEPRLLAAVRALAGRGVTQLRPPPWVEGVDRDPAGPPARVGVPVMPFPAWLRCTACNELAPIDSQAFGFDNDKPRRPHDARFFHENCPRKKKGRKPLAVAARFLLACTAGHLDDFPYVPFVHRGGPCPKATFPRLRMDDRGGNLGANVEIQCLNCGARRNIREVFGRRSADKLPQCRGRHPHLGTFEPGGCTSDTTRVLVLGASNQWFAQTLSALAVPRTGASQLQTLVEQHWGALEGMPNAESLPYARGAVPALRGFQRWSDAEIWAAIQHHRTAPEHHDGDGYPDLRTPEWEIFSAGQLPDPTPDFALRRDPAGVPSQLKAFFADVIQAERLREVRALIGFTRLDAPDPDDPDLVTRVALSRSTPTWVPASEVHGEGIFLRVPEELLTAWQARVEPSAVLRAHREAYARFRQDRYSDRIDGPFDPMRLWPGARYIALHTLSHLLIRAISLECGYNCASLSERIYAGSTDDPHAGILISTAVPDAEGTLGGLVTMAEPEHLVRLTRRALVDARRCSSDPLCAERIPRDPDTSLHGAACHVCLFVSETTCERGNRFLDRRLVVPIGDDPSLALFPDLP
ncbi:MAG: DUF1998 domain-containing protein [Micromonosporaceae bacterium]|nr:DUF1998 domain-containing protein [Micromonosporaceae bacterium]